MVQREILVVPVVLLLSFIYSASGARQSYVVYLGGQHEQILGHQLIANTHHKLLASVLGSKAAAKDAIFYSYTRSINGFAAALEEEQALALSELPQVISVFVNRASSLHTTRSWGFLGLEDEKEEIPPQSLWKEANFGQDVIVGNLDTGVWPESESFNDTGMGPVPSRWRGICQDGTEFGAAQCNRKLIGARYFFKGFEAAYGPLNLTGTGNFLSPRDGDGHGTHTLSTASGNFVKNASLKGYAKGIAKGGAPHARVAAYKVCWPTVEGDSYCTDADMLAAFDAGIDDGVDVFSVSIGAGPPLVDYFQNGLAIGAFHAVQKGKVVVCSAGNDGPTPGSVENVSPWIITVGASSIDRQFPSAVTLGNNRTFVGQSLSQVWLPKKKMYPLVSSADVTAPHQNKTDGQHCFPGSLDARKVKGKIVACLRGINSRFEKGEAVSMAGGLGMILCNAPVDGAEVDADTHVLPAANLNAVDGAKVFHYIKSTVSPVAYISPARTELNTKPAPMTTAFSSQGPNSLTPDILKPDIIAPGLNILASYSLSASQSGDPSSNDHVPFNIISGTSMACPHVAGVAALLKGAHPDWSPSAIKSAIMTTTTRLDNTKEVIKDSKLERAGPFNYGAGHINPNQAGNPGLVYDLSVEDYNNFLCSLNYNSTQIKAITGVAFRCQETLPKTHDLNYPSITVSGLHGSVVVKRTVKNLAKGPATYEATVESPDGISVSVEPQELQFSNNGETKSFNVTLRATKSSGSYVFGSLTWKGRDQFVVSPIVVKTSNEVTK